VPGRSNGLLGRAIRKDSIWIESEAVESLPAEEPSEVWNFIGEGVRNGMGGNQASSLGEEVPFFNGVHG
jgi:hypothetical protein